MRELMRRLSAQSSSAPPPPQDGSLPAKRHSIDNGSVGGSNPAHVVRPEDTPDALEAEAKYAQARRLQSEGEWARSLDVLNKVLVLQRRALGQDHPSAGRTLNDIGVALMHLGRYFPAQTALKEAEYIREEALGCGAPEVAETLTNLAILMDKVNQAEDMAHEREEKREVVRRRSFGTLSDDGMGGDSVRDYDSTGSADWDDDDDSDDGGSYKCGPRGRDDDDEDDAEKRRIVDELRRLEEQREHMRKISVQMAQDRKRMSMEHMEKQKQQQQQQQSGQKAKRRGSGSALFGGNNSVSSASGIFGDAWEHLGAEKGEGRDRSSSNNKPNLGSLGLNAMDAAKAVSAAAASGSDVVEAGHALIRRKSGGSLSGLSIDAAEAARSFVESETDSDDEEEPQPRHRRTSGPMPRRRSFGPLGGGGGGGDEPPPRQGRAPQRTGSFDHLSFGASLSTQMDLRRQIENDHRQRNGGGGNKPRRRMSGGILSSAFGGGGGGEDCSPDEFGRGGPRTYKELSMSKGPSVDLREQIRQDHDAPRRPAQRRFSNGLFSNLGAESDGDGGGVDGMTEQMRERMVFSGA